MGTDRFIDRKQAACLGFSLGSSHRVELLDMGLSSTADFKLQEVNWSQYGSPISLYGAVDRGGGASIG